MSDDHPYRRPMPDQMRQPQARKSYSALSTAEKWAYHTEVYALRRVILGASRDERTSPVDADGKWFNADLVDAAERRLREKHAKLSRDCKADTEARNAIRFADAERWRNSAEGKEYLLGSRPKQRRIRPGDYGLTATETAIHNPRTAQA